MHLHVCSAVVVPVYGNTPCLYMLAHVAGLPSARANINTQQVQNDTIYIYIYPKPICVQICTCMMLMCMVLFICMLSGSCSFS